MGFYAVLSQPEQTAQILEKVFSEYAELEDLGPITLFLLIFFNNIVITFVMMLLGTVFAISPIIFVWANGFMFGIILSIISAKIGSLTTLLGLLPHGIIEIPAALLAGGYGIWLGKKGYRALRYKEPLLRSIKIAMRGYVQYILPLFFVAACIEVFITQFILEAVIVK